MTKKEKTDKRLRQVFWIFTFLLLTEGIFRRWILPAGIQNVFLVIRDPFVLYAVCIGWRSGYIKNGHAVLMMLLGFVSFLSALAFGHGNIIVALYGVRIIALYFPFIYICARVLRRDDVLMIGKVLVLMLIPMVALTIVQFYSPQSAFVNLGVGGDEEGAGFGGALGYMRPPGIFTFISGLTEYYGCTYGFLLYFLISPEDSQRMGLSKRFLIACLIMYFVSIPVSISRTHFVQTVFISVFFMVLLFRQGKVAKKIIGMLCVVAVIFPLLFMISEDMQKFMEVFTVRFDEANEIEGGLGNSAVNRIFGYFFGALESAPINGYGTGLFSNFGMKYIYGSSNIWVSQYNDVNAVIEMEWGRIICEDGLIIGMLILLVRLHIAYRLVVKSYLEIRKKGDILPWLLLPYAGYALCVFGLRASYSLGFMVIMVVSCLTALKYACPRKLQSENNTRKECTEIKNK